MSTFATLKQQYSHEASILGSHKVVGTVYTPADVAQRMVFLLLDNHVANSGVERSFEPKVFQEVYLSRFMTGGDISPDVAQVIFDYFTKLKIVDLSCGTGALLLAYLAFLDYLAFSTGKSCSKRLLNYLENDIYGFDIEPRAISSFKDTLTAYAHQLGHDMVSPNLFCLNSLTDSLPLSDASIDLVIGNPPYIGEKNNLTWFKPVKATEFGKVNYEGKMDYFYFFIYKGHELLKSNGSLCYVSSNYFLTADGAKKLRAFIDSDFNMVSFLDFGDTRIFSDKKLHACLYVLQKTKSETITMYTESLKREKTLLKKEVHHEDGTISFIPCDKTRKVLSSMKNEQLGVLGQYYDINQGIVSGADAQFVYLNDAVETLPKSLHQYLRPFFKNSDIDHFTVKNTFERQILYIDRSDVCPELIEWLLPHRDKLSRRREVVNGTRAWYMLTWPRAERIFNDEKIVVPQRAKTNRFAYVNAPFYASADVYFITRTESSPYDLKTLTMILNSNLYKIWLANMGKKKGSLLELYATPLRNLPVPRLTESQLLELTRWYEWDAPIDIMLKESFKIFD